MPIQPGLLRVVRILRIGRLLRFFDAARGVRQLLFTIVKSAPALSNVGTLLFLIIFIYSILGMSMFGHVKFSKYITPVSNFQTFGSSICLLFRVSTAAGWNGVLEGLMLAPPFCDPDKQIPGGGGGVTKGDCGNKPVAIVFLVSYMFLIVQFIVNMYIAVILENFNDAQNQESVGITEDAIEDFYETWKQFDPKAKQFIEYKYLSDFLDRVSRPFRIEKPNGWFIQASNCPIRDGDKIHCLDVLQTLIKKIIGDDKCVLDETIEELMTKLEKKFKKKFPTRYKREITNTISDRFNVELKASRTIQRISRWHLLMHDINSLTNKRDENAAATAADPCDVDRTIENIERSIQGLVSMRKTEPPKQPVCEIIIDSADEYDDSEQGMAETPLL